MACQPAVFIVDPGTCAVPRLKPSWLAVCLLRCGDVRSPLYRGICVCGCVGEGGGDQVSCVGVLVQADTY